jgi:ElaA protein
MDNRPGLTNAVTLKFEELTVQQLYEVLQLRAEVFVVEQDCVYQDIDGYDDQAYHVLIYDQATLVAYTRILPPGSYFDELSIGRVLVSAQQYLIKFYETHGFVSFGKGYLEDGIPHIGMKRS